MDDKPVSQRFGALVISLDLELAWGVRGVYGDDYRDNLLGARRAIPAMLELFHKFEIAATWAAVGLLFAEDREESAASLPELRPSYRDPALDPYRQMIGKNEKNDPVHFGFSLIKQIAGETRQEIGTHTFSHYYCLEKGQTREQFQADLESAVRIAARKGFRVRSLVFPRNQVNPEYSGVLRAVGIESYRGSERGWMYRPSDTPKHRRLYRRLARAADSYVDLSGSQLVGWDELLEENGLCNVAGSRFLRPYWPSLRFAEPLRLARITGVMRRAAREGRIYHLWWHTHNFGLHLDESIQCLRYLLEEFSRCRDSFGMRSLAMGDIPALSGAPVEGRIGAAT